MVLFRERDNSHCKKLGVLEEEEGYGLCYYVLYETVPLERLKYSFNGMKTSLSLVAVN